MILMNDFRAEPEALLQREAAAAERVIRSGWYVLGNEVRQFEEAWAKRCGVRFAVGTGNGMDAIEVALRALGIGAGDEVITTSVTAFASVLAVMRAGATPVLADILPGSALLDPDSVVRCLSANTRALLLVHLYGQLRDMEKWQGFCNQAGVALVEDCAQAHGASWNGRVAGSFGSCGTYSFYPTKNLGALGDGGALITDSEEISERARMQRNYGQSSRYHHPVLGLNSRLDEIQAAILSERLGWLDRFNARRQEIATRYLRELCNPKVRVLDAPVFPESHVYHLFVVQCAQRGRLARHLKDRGIETLVHYPVPLHRQPPCQAMRRDANGLSRAERHAKTCLSIPCRPQMSDSQVAQVIDAVNQFR